MKRIAFLIAERVAHRWPCTKQQRSPRRRERAPSAPFLAFFSFCFVSVNAPPPISSAHAVACDSKTPERCHRTRGAGLAMKCCNKNSHSFYHALMRGQHT